MPKPSEITLAIREAFQAMNDLDSSSSEVKTKVVELHPELEKQTRGTRFAQTVSRVRMGLRETNGQSNGEAKPPVARRKRAKRKPQASTCELYGMALRFWERVAGNTQFADEILDYLNEVELDELRRAWEGWKQLVATAGSLQNARRVLEIQRQTGMIE